VKQLTKSDLILNNDGSIYHLGLHSDQIYPTVITVGDPSRVDAVSKHFDSIDYSNINREFKAVGGRLGNTPIMVLSTGIGTDNIDIVLNELSLLINFDMTTREPLEYQKSIRLIRLGTSGSIHPSIPIDSIVYSENAIAFDNLLSFYNHSFDIIKFKDMQIPVIHCSSSLEHLFRSYKPSLTLTACGFYGPQFRPSQLSQKYRLSDCESIRYKGKAPGNIEMETAGIYGLSKLLGFEAISVNAILADRRTGVFSKKPQKMIEKMIEEALDILCE
jgi:uridine phosphorylase